MRTEIPAAATIHTTYMPTGDIKKKPSTKGFYTALLGMNFFNDKKCFKFYFTFTQLRVGCLAYSGHLTNFAK